METNKIKGNSTRILIVDDEAYICEILSRIVEEEGFKAKVAYDGNIAMEMIHDKMPDVMLLDIKMPGMDGLEVLKSAKEMDPDLPVIIITAHAGINGAVEAMRAGAHDYLAKPFDHNEVIRVVRRAVAERDLKKKIKNLSNQLDDNISLRKTMGPSDIVGSIISQVNRVSKSDFTVVIQGETGSGKELVARSIHHASHRSAGPFIAIDCAAIPDTLMESELFGYERGAFTGATDQKIGKFEQAKGGTLLLDEISNMTMHSQAKLLRVIQEKKLYRVGGTKPLNTNVRILVACNQDLKTVSATGKFRDDLFYRLSELVINIPPLRQRREDIPYLAKRFLDVTNIELNKNVKGFSETALQSLIDFSWPGNVRQLRSIIRRAVLLADDIITDTHLDKEITSMPGTCFMPKNQPMPWEDNSLKEIVQNHTRAVEREVLKRAMKFSGGNKAKAARLLKIDYKTIHTKIKKLKIPLEGENYE
ncbi:MAG: sigma-54 dependent transcriptional regulator [Proteobacteria bacterium]|nr:sigma-54 dependent transcriptional regulator [Pseudomonadota bacterium]